MKIPFWMCVFLSATVASALQAEDAPALLAIKDEVPQRVWMTAASTANIEYKTSRQSQNRVRVPRSSVESIYFFEPESYKEAKRLFKNRDYKAAREKFALTKKNFKKLNDLRGNFSTRAEFYELECLRKDGDLDGLSLLLKEYSYAEQFSNLTRSNDKLQGEVYVLWDAVRTKSWTRLNGLADKMLQEDKWTSSQRAQIYYCKGLAMEGLEQKIAALNAFNATLTADSAGSEAITKLAALACLRILNTHEEVLIAKELFGTEDEDANSQGYRLMLEGAALCILWEKALGGGEPLPEEYKNLLKYGSKLNVGG